MWRTWWVRAEDFRDHRESDFPPVIVVGLLMMPTCFERRFKSLCNAPASDPRIHVYSQRRRGLWMGHRIDESRLIKTCSANVGWSILLWVWKWRSAVLIIGVQWQFTSYYPDAESKTVSWTGTQDFKIRSVEKILSNAFEPISIERLCLVRRCQMILAIARRNILFAQWPGGKDLMISCPLQSYAEPHNSKLRR